jgi:hypothetical protein
MCVDSKGLLPKIYVLMTLYVTQIHLKLPNDAFCLALNLIKGKIVHKWKFVLTSFPPLRARL